jgi:hypothetical protein
MNISFSNFNKELPQALIKQAQRLKVRDLDELSSKHFVAYVDDKSESYDVAIKIDAKKNVIESTCDCDQGNSFCVHKTALLIFLSEQKKTKAPVKTRAKKLDPLEVLMREIETGDLKKWLFPLLKKNAELCFLFEKEFSVTQKVFKIEDIETIVQEAVKSVVGRRKSIQTNEVAKLVNMLEVALQPVIDYVESDIKNVNNVLLILKLNDVLIGLHHGKHVSSVKLIRLVEKINHQFFGHINNIQDLDLWKKHLDFFFSNVFKLRGNNNNIVTEFLKNTYELAKLSPFKLEYFVTKFQSWIQQEDKKNLFLNEQLSIFILDFYIDNHLLKNSPDFLPVRYFSDTYNMKLIKALMDLEIYDIAILKCKQVIQTNYSEIYNIPYRGFLKEMYQKLNNVEELVEVLKLTIKYQFSLEDLSFLSKNMNPKEYSKILTTIKNHLRGSFFSTQGNNAIRDYFKILIFEEDYKKVFEDFRSMIPFDMIYEHREEFYNYDRKLFWDKLIDYYDYSEYNKPENQIIIAKLIEWAIEMYDTELIAYTQKRVINVTTSPFYRYYIKALGEKSNK